MRDVGSLPDDFVTYSSEAPGSGDSKINGTPWEPDTLTDSNPSVTVNFPTTAVVTSIVVQGGGVNGSFLSHFTIEVKNEDGQWEEVSNLDGTPKVVLVLYLKLKVFFASTEI